MGKKVSNNKNYKRITLAILSLIIILMIGFMSYIYLYVRRYNGLILPGVKVGNLDLSGKTKEEALSLLNEKHDSITRNNKITIKTKNKSYYIQYSNLDAKYNVSDTLEQAYSYGRNDNMFKKYFIIRKASNKNLSPKITYNPDPIKDVIKEIEKEVNKEAKDANITSLNVGNLHINPEVVGKKLLRDKLEKEIRLNINEKNGDSFTIDAPIETVKPKVTSDTLKTVDTLIASFSTNYRSSSYQRATNIKLATESINGTTILPGEVFSFNQVVGKRTADKGYMAAGVIVGNKLESGLGGGVCQVSTTLYNVILKTGLSSVERAHHSFPSSYVPFGMDATVDYGSIDYKFKNTFKYPIYIQGYTQGRVLLFNIYGNKSLKNRTYTIENSVYQTLNPTVEYKDEPNLEEGKTEVIQPAHTGYKVKVYRNIYENGVMIKKELISDDFYRPVNGLIKRGTKKQENTNPKPEDVKKDTKSTSTVENKPASSTENSEKKNTDDKPKDIGEKPKDINEKPQDINQKPNQN